MADGSAIKSLITELHDFMKEGPDIKLGGFMGIGADKKGASQEIERLTGRLKELLDMHEPVDRARFNQRWSSLKLNTKNKEFHAFIDALCTNDAEMLQDAIAKMKGSTGVTKLLEPVRKTLLATGQQLSIRQPISINLKITAEESINSVGDQLASSLRNLRADFELPNATEQKVELNAIADFLETQKGSPQFTNWCDIAEQAVTSMGREGESAEIFIKALNSRNADDIINTLRQVENGSLEFMNSAALTAVTRWTDTGAVESANQVITKLANTMETAAKGAVKNTPPLHPTRRPSPRPVTPAGEPVELLSTPALEAEGAATIFGPNAPRGVRPNPKPVEPSSVKRTFGEWVSGFFSTPQTPKKPTRAVAEVAETLPYCPAHSYANRISQQVRRATPVVEEGRKLFTSSNVAIGGVAAIAAAATYQHHQNQKADPLEQLAYDINLNNLANNGR